MTPSERGTGVSLPPPPPWAASTAPPATPVAPAAPVPPSPQVGGEDAGSRGAETVTVSSAAPPTAARPILDPTRPVVKTGKGGKRSLVVVAIALALAVIAAIVLAVMPHSSPATNTAPVGNGVAEPLGDDVAPPPEDTVPTAPPSTAPPTTQPLPPAQVVSRITTADPVVFITIDDGWYTPPEGLAQLMSGTVPVTTFLLGQVLDRNPELWKGIDKAAGSVENHSISHPAFAKLSLQQQQEQICATSEDIASKIGHFPTMFRPPYGSTNANTAIAAGNCGIKYVVKWGASVNKGKVTFASGEALRPGDIVLMHYRPELAQDLAAALAAAQAAGLKPALLTDYLK